MAIFWLMCCLLTLIRQKKTFKVYKYIELKPFCYGGTKQKTSFAPKTFTFQDLSWDKVLSSNYGTKKQYKIVTCLHY